MTALGPFERGPRLAVAVSGGPDSMALCLLADDWARARGCRELASDALIDNEISQRTHRALGFRETERVVYFTRPL